MLARSVIDELRGRRDEVLAVLPQGGESAPEERFEALMTMVGDACAKAVARSFIEPAATAPETAIPAQQSARLLECIRRGEVDAVLGSGPMAGEVLVLKTQQLEQENRSLFESLQKEKERLEEFSYATAHDLRGPLSNIENEVSTLLEQHARSRLPLWFVDSFRRIQQAAARMRLLVSDLMALGEAGSEGEPIERVPLLDVVAAVLDGQQSTLARTRVHVDVVDRLPAVRGRVRHLEAMFDNLIDNAIRYACMVPRGSVRIACERSEDEIILCVRDNGPGFDPREAQAVFEPYVRLDHRGDNTGLGLTIVRNAARAHGGRAWIETTPGEGTAAFVALPAGCVSEPNWTAPVAHGSPAL